MRGLVRVGVPPGRRRRPAHAGELAVEESERRRDRLARRASQQGLVGIEGDVGRLGRKRQVVGQRRSRVIDVGGRGGIGLCDQHAEGERPLLEVHRLHEVGLRLIGVRHGILPPALAGERLGGGRRGLGDGVRHGVDRRQRAGVERLGPGYARQGAGVETVRRGGRQDAPRGDQREGECREGGPQAPARRVRAARLASAGGRGVRRVRRARKAHRQAPWTAAPSETPGRIEAAALRGRDVMTRHAFARIRKGVGGRLRDERSARRGRGGLPPRATSATARKRVTDSDTADGRVYRGAAAAPRRRPHGSLFFPKF